MATLYRKKLRSSKSENEPEDEDAGANQLLCGECGKDLISAPNSIRCDSENCKILYHPSCLGDEGPIDSEKWFCKLCEPSPEYVNDLPDINLVETSGISYPPLNVSGFIAAARIASDNIDPEAAKC